MDRFNMISYTILSKYYRIIEKSIILNLNVYYNKLYFATILKSNYLFVLIVILQPEKWNKINILSLQNNLIVGKILKENLKIGALVIMNQ